MIQVLFTPNMVCISKASLLALGSFLAPSLAASLSAGTTSATINTRVTSIGGVFRDGQQVSGTGIAMGGLIVADADAEFVSEIQEKWINAQGTQTGIYYELQQVGFIVYPDQSKPWPTGAGYAVYLAPK